MAQLESKPDPVKPGQWQLSAQDLNRTRDVVLRQIRGGGDARVSYYGDRVVVSSLSGQDRPGPIDHTAQMVVLEEYDDYLLCTPFRPPVKEGTAALLPQPYDPLLGTHSVVYAFVAKPYLLQKAPWDGKTVTFGGVRTLLAYSDPGRRGVKYPDFGDSEIQQTVSPPYVPGDVLLAAHAATGHTGPDSSPVVWADLNVGGRRWDAPQTAEGIVVQAVTAPLGHGPGATPGKGKVVLVGLRGGSVQELGPPVVVYNWAFRWAFTVGMGVGLRVNGGDGQWYVDGPPSFPFVTKVCPGPSSSGSGGSAADCTGPYANSACCPGSLWPETPFLTVSGPCTAMNGTFPLACNKVVPNWYWGGPDGNGISYNGRTLVWRAGCDVGGTSGMFLQGSYYSGGSVSSGPVQATGTPSCTIPPTVSGTAVVSGGPCDGMTINWSIA